MRLKRETQRERGWTFVFKNFSVSCVVLNGFSLSQELSRPGTLIFCIFYYILGNRETQAKMIRQGERGREGETVAAHVLAVMD